MLGWHIFITRQAPGSTPAEPRPSGPALASWEAGLGGLNWLDALVEEGKAVSLGGNGYPLRYTVSTAALLSKLAAGPPPHDGPMVLGDDYVTPKGWLGNARIDRVALAACPLDDDLLVEAWDLS
jgi:hypothetical protein